MIFRSRALSILAAKDAKKRETKAAGLERVLDSIGHGVAFEFCG
jgi:hypothetical protein